MNFLDLLFNLPELFLFNVTVVFIWLALYLRLKIISQNWYYNFNYYSIFVLFLLGLLYINFPVASAIYLNGGAVVTNFELFLKLLTVGVSILVFLVINSNELWATDLQLEVEVISVRLFIINSLLLLVSTNDFIYLFFILEVYALCSYILVGIKGKLSVFSSEAALKYFIVGTVFSIVLCYGIALIYFSTGLLNFADLEVYFSFDANSAIKWDSFDLFKFGVLLLLIGLLFKLAAAPFHFWAPDVYEGAPTSTTFFLFSVPKIAVLAIMLKMSFLWSSFIIPTWLLIFAIFLSVAIGSIGGLFQKRIKRLLTYSMINNNGFFLIPIIFSGLQSSTFMFFFLFLYLFSLVGLFASTMSLKIEGFKPNVKTLWIWNNMFFINKILALATALLFFSSAGLPPLAGFISKFIVLLTAVSDFSNFYILIIISLIFAPLSCFFYIRVVKIMAFSKKEYWLYFKQINGVLAFIVSLSVVLLFLLFLTSGTLLNYLLLINL